MTHHENFSFTYPLPFKKADGPTILRGNDDCPRGRLLFRTEAMTILAGAGAFMLVGRVAFGQEDTCIVRPELTEEPYCV